MPRYKLEHCPGCMRLRRLSRHHLKPIAQGGTAKDGILEVCDTCHTLIHKRLGDGKLYRGPKNAGRLTAWLRSITSESCWPYDEHYMAPTPEPPPGSAGSTVS